ncbi:MAG: ribonuclease Z [Candidatus Bathyarchaeota archaeon]|nr:ribonuclease Z [Candidatus Bathyarchaeota archaeon]
MVFLGTSGSMPTPERGSSSVALCLGRSVVLLDCGEGTQRQMVAAHIGFSRVKLVLVTHLHGDHVLGVPGLLQSMTLQRREEPLTVYGPRGIHAFLQGVSDTLGGPGFPVTVHEIAEPGVVLDAKGYTVEACKSDHRLESWSYAVIERSKPGRFHPEKAARLGVPQGIIWKRLQDGEDVDIGERTIKSSDVVDPPRPGRKVVYSGDTRPSDDVAKLATGADLLIHESTFGEDLVERAAEDGHSTAGQAAGVAAKAGVKRLVLTHISGRYSDAAPLLDEAKRIFPNSSVAADLLEVDVPPA